MENITRASTRQQAAGQGVRYADNQGDGVSSPDEVQHKQSKKHKWTPEEDERLLEVVREQGGRNWIKIADSIPGRNPKQCRERWTTQVRPSLSKEEWSKEEDTIILKYHRKFGNSWARIASYLMGRSANAVKNRFNWLERRKKKHERQLKKETEDKDKVKKTKTRGNNKTKTNLTINANKGSIERESDKNNMIQPTDNDWQSMLNEAAEFTFPGIEIMRGWA